MWPLMVFSHPSANRCHAVMRDRILEPLTAACGKIRLHDLGGIQFFQLREARI